VDERDLLRQARLRALTRLQTTCAPLERATLEQTIADLDRRIAHLASTAPSESST
jgi:hypothetical protein